MWKFVGWQSCNILFDKWFTKAYLCLGKKNYVIYLSTNDNFITNNPLQLLQVTNPTKGPAESIIFHNISQLNDENMLD
jgi:hypothetical protein